MVSVFALYESEDISVRISSYFMIGFCFIFPLTLNLVKNKSAKMAISFAIFSILTITYDFFLTIRFDLGQRPGPAGSPPGAPVSTHAARCLSTRQARSATPKRNTTPLDSAQLFRAESKETRSAWGRWPWISKAKFENIILIILTTFLSKSTSAPTNPSSSSGTTNSF